jgi:crotonobetainyl-CoA:carnitine CoA-transferase CaiB-like acyl-CoA transferase
MKEPTLEHRRRGAGAPPLAGVRVLDLTAVVAGPYCTTMLADMGAEIVKVERAVRGDDTRTATRYQGREEHEDYFNAINRSKKSIALDLKQPAAREVAQALAEKADVVVENFKPGTAARLGLGWDDLRAVNPHLVYCSISGFGQDGPLRDRLALDPVVQAVAGMMSVTGEPDGAPMLMGTSICDIISGMFAAYAVVSALHAVDKEGAGRYIDVSMQAAGLAVLGTRMGETLQAGRLPPRMGNENPMRVPANCYATRDNRFLQIMVLNQDHWAPFCRAMAHEEWIDDPRFATPVLRVERRDTLNHLVAEAFAERTLAEWTERLTAARLAFAPVQNYREALNDPQIQHRGTVRELRHPTAGDIRVVGPPWKFGESETPMAPPPLLGQHTEEILRDWLDWTPARIAAFQKERAADVN